MAKIDPAIEKYMACRLVGHTWRILSDDEDTYESRYGLFHLTLSCQTCPTVRIDAFDALGQVMTRRYDYPDDYHTEEVTYRPEVRRAFVAAKAKGRKVVQFNQKQARKRAAS